MRRYVWYVDKPNLNSAGTIYQVLAYGSLSAVKEIINKQGLEKTREIFLKKPQKVYTPSALNFIAKYILHIDRINENRYLKTTSRSLK